MPARISPSLGLTLELSAALVDAAIRTAQLAVTSARPPTRSPKGRSLKPGSATPLWNEVAGAALAHLSRRGDHVRLARLLGVPRQRLHEILKSRRYLPDAECTLLLLVWLQAKQSGRDLC